MKSGRIPSNRSIAERLQDRELIRRAMAEAVAEAVLRHKRAGNPVCASRGGKVVWIDPADIPEPNQ